MHPPCCKLPCASMPTARADAGMGHTHTHVLDSRTHRAPPVKILRSAHAWTRAWLCGRVRARAWHAQ